MIRTAILSLALCAAMAAEDGAPADRVGTTGFVQLTAESFHKLTPREQALAYWLSEASIATDPIIYGQLSRFGLRQKLLLETDAPYLLPRDLKPAPKSRRNEPAYLPHIAATVASLRGESLESVAEAATQNAVRLFGLDSAQPAVTKGW